MLLVLLVRLTFSPLGSHVVLDGSRESIVASCMGLAIAPVMCQLVPNRCLALLIALHKGLVVSPMGFIMLHLIHPEHCLYSWLSGL